MELLSLHFPASPVWAKRSMMQAISRLPDFLEPHFFLKLIGEISCNYLTQYI